MVGNLWLQHSKTWVQHFLGCCIQVFLFEAHSFWFLRPSFPWILPSGTCGSSGEQWSPQNWRSQEWFYLTKLIVVSEFFSTSPKVRSLKTFYLEFKLQNFQKVAQWRFKAADLLVQMKTKFSTAAVWSFLPASRTWCRLLYERPQPASIFFFRS